MTPDPRSAPIGNSRRGCLSLSRRARALLMIRLPLRISDTRLLGQIVQRSKGFMPFSSEDSSSHSSVMAAAAQAMVILFRSESDGQSQIEKLPISTFVDRRRTHGFHLP